MEVSIIEIVESYRIWEPPTNAREAVISVLRSVPDEYLMGLNRIVLTDADGLNRARRRKKTRHRGETKNSREAIGIYHQAWQGQKAYIELFVDNIVAQCPKAMKISPLRDLVFADVLFHEIGHHIHMTRTKVYREREEVADEWIHRLGAAYLKRKWYLRPLGRIFDLKSVLRIRL
jgi:hypothetical protein